MPRELPPPLPGDPPRPRRQPPILLPLAGAGIVAALLLLLPICFWIFCRVSPKADEIVVWIRKTGQNLPEGAVIAAPGQKGIQLEVSSEGRHFFNPYSWQPHLAAVTDIPAGKLGVVTRLFGPDLPSGEILAQGDSKGILPDVLLPGKHRINPFAFDVRVYDATTIRPGHVGVQVSLVGTDPFTGDGQASDTYIVPDGHKGVMAATLDPGTHYLNPFLRSVVEVNLQSQRFEMSGADSIDFLTLDGFPVRVEGTIEYALDPAKVAMLTHQVGDMEDIIQKIILPHARGFGRLEGSKNPALNYILGETRQKFQDQINQHLVERGSKWGIEIRSVLVRNISPPDEIASIIRDRELAAQNRLMYEQQIAQAKSRAELVKQEMLALQNKEKVKAETEKLQAVILAKQNQQVALTAAQQNLGVARLENRAAQAQAEATLARARGEQTVLRAQNEAEANVLQQQSQAFGGGQNFARYLFNLKVGPQIEQVLANDGPDGLGALFSPYLPEKK